jgi:hypothetical protein
MPDLVLEQKALGELPVGMEGELERLLQEDGTAVERLAAIARSNREILEQYPPGPMVAQIKRRAAGAQAEKRRSWGLWVGLPSLAAAAAAALFVLVPAMKQERPGPLGVFGATEGPEVVTIKGDSRLMIYRRGAPNTLLSGEVVAEGDNLMVHYFAQGDATHGVILSVDGRGGVSLHFPRRIDGDTRLVQGSDQPLEDSFELDDAPRFERFFFLTSKRPIDVKAVKEALGTRGEKARPRLPSGVVIQQEIRLRKKRNAQVTP